MKHFHLAQEQHLDYKTAYRWFRLGVLPLPSEQIAKTGTILVHPDPKVTDGVALYVGVSSPDQKPDPDRQVACLLQYAAKEGRRVDVGAQEIGSGMNGHRQQLLDILKDPRWGKWWSNIGIDWRGFGPRTSGPLSPPLGEG